MVLLFALGVGLGLVQLQRARVVVFRGNNLRKAESRHQRGVVVITEGCLALGPAFLVQQARARVQFHVEADVTHTVHGFKSVRMLRAKAVFL